MCFSSRGRPRGPALGSAGRHRAVTSVLIFLLLLVSLAGCDSNNAEPDQGQAVPPAFGDLDLQGAQLQAIATGMARSAGAIGLFHDLWINDGMIPRQLTPGDVPTTTRNGFDVYILDDPPGFPAGTQEFIITNEGFPRSQRGVAYAFPVVDNGDGTITQELQLGVINSIEAISNSIDAAFFFGSAGRVFLTYDPVPMGGGNRPLVRVEFQELRRLPEDDDGAAGPISTFPVLGPYSGTLTPSTSNGKQLLTGNLFTGDPNNPTTTRLTMTEVFSIDYLYEETQLAFNFIVREGTVFVNERLESSAMDGGSTTAVAGTANGVVSTTTPQGVVESVPDIDHETAFTMGQEDYFLEPTDILVLFLSFTEGGGGTIEQPRVGVDQVAQVFLAATDAQGVPKALTVRGFTLSVGSPEILLLGPSTTQVTGRSPGQSGLQTREILGAEGRNAATAVTVFAPDPPPPPPGEQAGFLYIANSADDEIVRYAFNPTTGALEAPVQLNSVSADPFDLFITRDEGRLLVGAGSETDVYTLNEDGSLTYQAASADNNVPLRQMVQSELPGLAMPRIYGSVASDTRIDEFTLNADGSLTMTDSFDVPEFVIDVAALQAGDNEFLFVSGLANLQVINTATGAVTEVVPPAPFLPGELEVMFPSGPVLHVLERQNGVLFTVPINSDTGMLDFNNATAVATTENPRALTGDRDGDNLYIGSQNELFLGGFLSQAPPTAPMALPNQPYATSGGVNGSVITGIATNLLFAITSPQDTLQGFTIQGNQSLMSLGSQTVPGTAPNLQDIQAVVFGD